jgi:hypothetical protein
MGLDKVLIGGLLFDRFAVSRTAQNLLYTAALLFQEQNAKYGLVAEG